MTYEIAFTGVFYAEFQADDPAEALRQAASVAKKRTLFAADIIRLQDPTVSISDESPEIVDSW